MVEQQIKTTPEQDLVREQFIKGVYHPPSSIEDEGDQLKQLVEVLTQHEKFLQVLKMELRGEQLYQSSEGERYWVQTDKPMFIKVDRYNKPIKVFNERMKKYEFICNDDAINEVINIVKMCGANPISPMTVISDEEIRADLFEMESKIAVMLFNNRQKWGIAKSEYPIYVGKLKIIIKDARYRSKDGIALKALRTMTSRIEQSSEAQRNKNVMEKITSPFK
jgi:hypothetical protein